MTHDSEATSAGSLLADVEVVIVAYRSRQHVEELLKMWPAELAVVVIDNSANIDGLADLTAEHRNLRYLDGGGQGYARAANLGAFSSAASRIVFVNPDSRPTVADLLALLGGLMADATAVSHDAVTAENTRIEMGVGGWEPTVRRTAIQAVGLHKIWPRAGIYAKPERGEDLKVDWTAGTCMAVDATKFCALGGFDESYYLYTEDVSFGRAARRAGLRTVLRTDVVVAHAAGNSGASRAEMFRVRGATFAHYVSRYNGRLRAILMRGILAAGLIARTICHGALGKRNNARLFYAVAQGLITGRAHVDGVEVAGSRYAEVSRRGAENEAHARRRA